MFEIQFKIKNSQYLIFCLNRENSGYNGDGQICILPSDARLRMTEIMVSNIVLYWPLPQANQYTQINTIHTSITYKTYFTLYLSKMYILHTVINLYLKKSEKSIFFFSLIFYKKYIHQYVLSEFCSISLKTKERKRSRT